MTKIIYIRTNIKRGFMGCSEEFCEENGYVAKWVKDEDTKNPFVGGVSIGFTPKDAYEDAKNRERINSFAWPMSRDPFPRGHMFPEDEGYIMNHHIIGDVHGHYEALLQLVKQLPQEENIIFVGDLIDRGGQSAEVVKLIRKNGYRSVKGNHEELMIRHGQGVIDSIGRGDKYINIDPTWKEKGSITTLLSYHLISHQDSKGRLVRADDAQEFIEQFKDDMEWMRFLPLHIELWNKDEQGRPVVISHAAIDKVWNSRKNISKLKEFEEAALRNRDVPDNSSPIFNIFGHTPQPNPARIEKHYVNIDTGAYIYSDSKYGKLSAYCIETGKVLNVNASK